MKKIFFIGKFNVIFQDINNYLGQYFNVQMCVDNHEVIKGMLKLNQPDLIIISLIGLEKEKGKILSELRFNYSQMPGVCIGTESEQENFKEISIKNSFIL